MRDLELRLRDVYRQLVTPHSKIIHSNGGAERLLNDGTTAPWRWYHTLQEKFERWWFSRDFHEIQDLFHEKHGTRYYGDGGTWHGTRVVNVELTEKGEVVSVWFRCQMLPFDQHIVNDQRAQEMRNAYKDYRSTLHGVEIKDPEKGN